MKTWSTIFSQCSMFESLFSATHVCLYSCVMRWIQQIDKPHLHTSLFGWVWVLDALWIMSSCWDGTDLWRWLEVFTCWRSFSKRLQAGKGRNKQGNENIRENIRTQLALTLKSRCVCATYQLKVVYEVVYIDVIIALLEGCRFTPGLIWVTGNRVF